MYYVLSLVHYDIEAFTDFFTKFVPENMYER